MAKRGGGSILTLTYSAASGCFPNNKVMGVAKAALEATVRYLAADMGPANVRVNAVSAGPGQDAGGCWYRRLFQHPSRLPERAPLRRNVDAAEVGDASAFLLSDAARGTHWRGADWSMAGFHVTGM
jgi:enoyl-[acyl-carrier protein] reductase I